MSKPKGTKITASASEPTRAEVLATKQKELAGIGNAIGLYARKLTVDEKSQVDDLESRMEFRLAELVTESKIKEAEIKIEVMRQVLEITKKPAVAIK